ncbi:cell division protein FtsL [Caenispirillum bisanense]|uniref:cell division protein FtsL n=1 Tax=Caenispirillum bisanense TaxID=414052 RepID=UPI0031CFA53C
MIRAAAVVWSVLAIAVGVGLFMLKYEVQGLEDELSRLNREIRADRAAVHVLEAEWSYLNDPARLRELATRHLGLAPLAPDQVSTVAQLPLRPPPSEAPAPAPKQDAPKAKAPPLPTPAPAAPGGRVMAAMPPPPPQAELASATTRTVP